MNKPYGTSTACPSAASATYPAHTTCVMAVNKLTPEQFQHRIVYVLRAYPHLRSKLSNCFDSEAMHTDSIRTIAHKLLDSYLAHTMNSQQLLTLDEFMQLSIHDLDGVS